MSRRSFGELGGAALGAAILAGCSSGGTSSTGAGTPADPTSTTTLKPSALLDPDQPFWLQGNFAPVADELTDTDLVVEGNIPDDLAGLYVRNGPNQQVGTAPHWFLGDGMLHGVWLGGGAAKATASRWTATPLLGEQGYEAIPSGASTQANVSMVHHGGRLLALGEVGFPYEIDPSDLATVGPYDFGGALTTSMTAHPKVDPVTGEMHFFGYGFAEPFLTYHRTDANGGLVASQEIEIPRPVMMHDFAMTESTIIFMDLPVVLSADTEGMPFLWDEEAGARIGLMPITGGDVRWFDIDPCFVFHTINAYDDGDTVVLEAVRYPHMWLESSTETFPAGQPWRWTINPTSGLVTDEQLDDRTVEFPKIDPGYVGRESRYWFGIENPALSALTSADGKRSGLFRHDRSTDTSATWQPPPNQYPDEALFVAHPDATAEGQGWLLSYVYDADRDGSDLVILSAEQMDEGPIARVQLPRRVPHGFHGAFVPA